MTILLLLCLLQDQKATLESTADHNLKTHNSAIALMTESRYGEAIALLESHGKKHGNKKFGVLLAWCYLRDNQLEKAKLRAEQNLHTADLTSIRGLSHGTLGTVAHRMGDYELAAKHMDQAIEIFEDEVARGDETYRRQMSVNLHLFLTEAALIHGFMGNLGDADVYLERASFYNDLAGNNRAYYYGTRSMLLMMEGRFDDSLYFIKQYISHAITPKEKFSARVMLALVLCLTNDLKQANVVFKELKGQVSTDIQAAHLRLFLKLLDKIENGTVPDDWDIKPFFEKDPSLRTYFKFIQNYNPEDHN